MNVLVPIAGPDTFREHGYAYTKNLVEIAGLPLIQHVFENLRTIPDARFLFVMQKEEAQSFHLANVVRLLDPTARAIICEGKTAGAACTALLAIEWINNDQELLIANGDQLIRGGCRDFIDQLRGSGLDAGTLVFESVHPRWSYVRLNDDGLVIEAAEKRPISRNATAGVYYFRRGRDFVDAAQAMIRKDASVNGLFYVCPTFNELVLRQMRVGVVRIPREDYISLATPQNVEHYEQSLSKGGSR
jgi:dTDP-glucose pyrophosphorylase